MPKDPKPQREKKPRGERLQQFKTLYKGAAAQNPKIPFYMAGAFILGFVLVMLVNLVWYHPIYLGILGVMVGLLLAVVVFARVAERSAYAALEGQPGASGAALQGLRRGWFYEQEPVAAEAGRARNVQDMANAAMVFRAVGKPGVVLIGEGPRGHATKLLAAERKRVARVVGPEVPVTTYRVGEGDDAISVRELPKAMGKLDKKLTDAEVGQVNKRLKSLGSKRPPIPAGMDPRGRNAKVDRRAMRGR
ncbi:DUF4191 family protein [Calidifontibacter sp. DB0510]|uniref:DUF4191 family protein n=1 Tax=Metallococcus carri TaxID=1656884 RepID=A0A967B241_9MICO|nr:DUF4191 domain-containing protein [Metallococcus carri]NHN55985.1 DUF4191 family protein [Metallococcus carri]NOP37558.1 DUF4191 family protein [Calidifontibacter sp. DB2511S]